VAASPVGLFPGGPDPRSNRGTWVVASAGGADARNVPTPCSAAETGAAPDPEEFSSRAASADRGPATEGLVRYHHRGTLACRGPEPCSRAEADLPRGRCAGGVGLDRRGGVVLRSEGPQSGGCGRSLSIDAGDGPRPGAFHLSLRSALPSGEERPGLGPIPPRAPPTIQGLASGLGRLQRWRDPGRQSLEPPPRQDLQWHRSVPAGRDSNVCAAHRRPSSTARRAIVGPVAASVSPRPTTAASAGLPPRRRSG
jgi:hypothetical protein